MADMGEKVDLSAQSRQPDGHVEGTAADVLSGRLPLVTVFSAYRSHPLGAGFSLVTSLDDVDQRFANDQCPHPLDATGSRKALTAYTLDSCRKWWIAMAG